MAKHSSAQQAAQQAAFTLLEVIIVISLMALVYAVAFPNFSLQKESQITDRLARLSEDVRAVFDMAVLSGKPHRLVFDLRAGEYLVQRSDQAGFFLSGQAEEGGDPSPKQEDERRAEFDEQFKEYLQLAGEPVKDAKGDKEIPPASPVLKAKERLRGGTWKAAEGMGWNKRSLGDFLLLKDLQSEHHAHPITLDENTSNPIAMVYFFPRGYVERTVMHIYVKLDQSTPDPDQPPYTVLIDPNLGTAEVKSGYEEINVQTGKGK